MKDKQKTYTFTRRYGMEGQGDFENEYKTPDEIEANILRNKEYVNMCKRTGVYGKEYTITLTVQDNGLFDVCYVKTEPIESYRMDIIKLNNDGRDI